MHIRTATPADAKRLLEIYAPYVEDTAISFEMETPSVEEFRGRITKISQKYPYLVAEEEGRIVGYAYAGVFKDRRAYDHCVETTVYVSLDHHGRGVGKALYTELEKCLSAQGITNLNACIAWAPVEGPHLTNDSEAFHAAMGYTKVAHFHRCGYKFGEYWDMIWMEKILS